MRMAVVVLAGLLASLPAEAQRWFRGNTHTHTINSDGDASPDTVVRWYKEHGYHFVVLSDHNFRTPVEGLNAVFAAQDRFLVLAGEEVTDQFEGAPVHLIGIGVRESVQPQGGPDTTAILDRDARAIRAAGGLPHVNHPNFGWALTAEQIAASTEVHHFEMMNGHPGVHNRGGGDAPSTEELWDKVLSTGRMIYAIASDDAHYFNREFKPDIPNPGRAWIMVRAPQLTQEALLEAIEKGDFYCSTGVQIKDIQVNGGEIRIELPEESGRNAVRYSTYFLGKDGMLLKRDDTTKPFYLFRGDELYVRVRIQASNGATAWLQPVFLKK